METSKAKRLEKSKKLDSDSDSSPTKRKSRSRSRSRSVEYIQSSMHSLHEWKMKSLMYSSKVGLGFWICSFGRGFSIRLGLSLSVQVRLQVPVGVSPVWRCGQPIALARRIRKVQKLQVCQQVEPCKTSTHI